MNRLLLALGAATAAGFVLTACGGISGIDDVFNSSGSAGGSGGSQATTGVTTGHGGEGVTSVTVTSGPGTTVTTGSSMGGAGGTGPGATGTGPGATGPGSTGPGATGPGATGPGATSTGTGVGDTMVFCANGPCAQGEICCFNTSMPGDHCGQPGTCGDGFIQIDCNGAEDCPGAICCADVDFQMQVPYLGVSCQASCDGQNHLVMCNMQSPNCPMGKQCKQSQVLGQGYGYCN
jgi:hypothetical protein